MRWSNPFFNLVVFDNEPISVGILLQLAFHLAHIVGGAAILKEENISFTSS